MSSMLEGSAYQSLMDKVNKVRSYGLSDIISIPQIAIVGDQSTGKSSVLEAVTKLSFPRDKNMCTKFATQVSLRCDPRSHEDRLSACIKGNDAFNTKFLSIDPSTEFEGVIKAADDVLCRSRSKDISDEVLELTLTGPTQSPLTIIDLPGFINIPIDGQDKNLPDMIRAINGRYMQDPRTIILAVHPATSDLNNSYALAEAGKVDPNGERTIPIITRPDEVPNGLLEDVVEMILNKRKFMRLGYLVMRNSAYVEMSESWDKALQREIAFFQESNLWKNVPDSVKGRESVKRFLGNLLHSHIKKELPLLKKEIVSKIEALERTLEAMGNPVSTTAAARVAFTMMASNLKGSLNNLLTGQYAQQYIDAFKDSSSSEDDTSGRDDDKERLSIRFVRSTLHQLYREYSTSMADGTQLPATEQISALTIKYRGSELPGFLPYNVFLQIFKGILSDWKRHTREHVERMCKYFYEAITAYINYDTDSLMLPVVLETFDSFYRTQKKRIDDRVHEIFRDEAHPFTVNEGFFDKISKLREKKSGEKGSKNQNAASNEQAAAEDLSTMLVAYCNVSRERIADVIPMQTVERHLVWETDTLFRMLITVDDKALDGLIESPEKQALRRSLKERIDILERSLSEL
ncbi:hypothetical protein DFQ27_003638 [Actinomortierella ambigua]|uniref:Uncharacterized protein n=1 Tax=Actinomortierella ambigua TaxID=1343610 RepID=A0A9P6Q7M1_9FUNG|nr:hypothetical protein DFQ27_003638 [Actinomortierella ambigua]